MEKTLKKQIVDAAEAVKKKIRKMKDIEIDNNQTLESMFKPVTEPLNLIANASMQPPRLYATGNEEADISFIDSASQKENLSKVDGDYESDKDSDCSFQSLVENKQGDTSSWSITSEALAGVPYGVRVVDGNLMLGSARITISDEYINVSGHKYQNTPGLKQLLLKKDVDLSLVTDRDMQHYKSMLLDTNAHRRDYDSGKPIKSNKGQKYLQVIKPLFKLQSTIQDSIPKGKGLSLTKMWKKNTDFVYWDDPNELVDRLKLLIASRDAGNTGVNNEIISIIEELRENKIIHK